MRNKGLAKIKESTVFEAPETEVIKLFCRVYIYRQACVGLLEERHYDFSIVLACKMKLHVCVLFTKEKLK